MGPCERAGGQRWWRVAAVGVLLLHLGLAQTNPARASCSADEVQHNITHPNYHNTSGRDTSAAFMSAPVQSFLHTVQPKPFPKDLVREIYEAGYQTLTSDQTLVKKVLLYEIGFLVCVAIGVLYIVVMPLVGIFLACCRCCGHCGGKMYQKQAASSQCRRRTLYWSAFVTAVIILAGNICMFRSNQALKESVENGFQDVNQTMDNVKTFVNSLQEQVNHVLSESSTVVDAVIMNIDAVGPQLGLAIQTSLRGNLDPALESVRRLDQEAKNIHQQVTVLNSTLDQLQASMHLHQADLTVVKTSLSAVLSRPQCIGCSNMRNELRTLTLETSVNKPGMSQFQAALDAVIQSNLASITNEADGYMNDLPQTITDATRDIAQMTKQELQKISQMAGSVDLSVLSNLDNMLDDASRQIDQVTPHVKKAEMIRWKVSIAVCCVVLLVVVCNFLGLVLGPVGLSHSEDPTKRSSTADCGGTFLMMSAGISFLFSWLFMLIVLILFLLGGNVYTGVCQPWRSGELLKFIDSLEVISQLGYSTASGDKINFNISDVYSMCQRNQPLWSTLHLEQFVDLDDLLSISKYTDEIQQQFDNLVISLPTFTLLTPEVKQELNSFSAESENIDLTSVSRQLNSMSRVNLNTTADQLDRLAVVQTNNQIKTDIQAQADELRQIQSNIETTTFPLLQQLNSTIDDLETTIGTLKDVVADLLRSVDAAQTFLKTNTSQIVKTESGEFLNCQIRHLVAYADWARLAITKQVGRCGTVAKAVDSAETVLCSYVTESLNAFWFSLGWCVIFFIPSIILSIKLAKYYRRMKYSDVYENSIKLHTLQLAS